VKTGVYSAQILGRLPEFRSERKSSLNLVDHAVVAARLALFFSDWVGRHSLAAKRKSWLS
jgi:hypothetical protein